MKIHLNIKNDGYSTSNTEIDASAAWERCCKNGTTLENGFTIVKKKVWVSSREFFLILAFFIFNQVFAFAENVKVYPVLNDMIRDKTLGVNDYVKILGFYKMNDGGSAEYIVSKPRNSDTSAFIHKLSNGLSAVLITPLAVNYKMFGAKGDGISNDAIAIAEAHQYANKRNLPVLNERGEFWLKGTKKISIQTDVNWGSTIFHIDERFNVASAPRFEISSRYKPQDIVLTPGEKATLLSAIKPGAGLIPLLAKYKNCLLFIADAKDQIGFRSGADFKGQSWAREDFFYVEEHGRIIGDIAWSFKDYTTLTAYHVDENYLKAEGGIFYLSGDNPTNNARNYLGTGIAVTRSRTIITGQWIGLEQNKKDTSTLNPRGGFYRFSRVYDVTLENVRLIPYEQNRGDEKRNVSRGTYGISMARVLECRFKNVTAEGSAVHWGVFGSNLVKNFSIDNCRINRVDVHFHCWNLRISNSQIGYKGITVTGGGNLIVENSSCAGRSFINFRSDFGSKWEGDISITNSTFNVSSEAKEVYVLAFTPGNFDYKYPVGFGRSITIQNFAINFQGVENKEATCWLMRVPSFSKMKTGQRLFFPDRLKFEDISVKGRQKGVRLIEIKSPGSYQLTHRSSNRNAASPFNADFLFKNIDLEDLDAESPSAAHFNLNGEGGYEDGFALYPTIRFDNCSNLVLKSEGSIANIYLNECSISGFNADGQKSVRGRLIFTSCNFYPVLKQEGKSIYNLNSENGTNFTNCVVHAPVYKNELHPELFDKIGFIEINRKVKYNHSNTLLGREVLNYYKNKNIGFKPQFVSMLKNHHEMEPETVK